MDRLKAEGFQSFEEQRQKIRFDHEEKDFPKNIKQRSNHDKHKSTNLIKRKSQIKKPTNFKKQKLQTKKGPDEESSDEIRLGSLMKRWPREKPKATIYVLIQGDYYRMSLLKRFLRSLDTNFNNEFQYPLILFHESDVTEEIKVTIRNWTKSDVYFQNVSFSIPTFLTKPIVENIPCYSKIGYRHMCRFQLKSIYELPIIDAFEYYWRFDDDSELLSPVQYDVFKFMREHDMTYGYIWKFLDNYDCTYGLWNATREYIQKQQITPHFFHEWKEPSLYYNNFEIARFDIWKSKSYITYIDYLDRLGGIYYHRWGDAPIKGLAVSLFIPKNKTHIFSDIHYRHTSFTNTPGKPNPGE